MVEVDLDDKDIEDDNRYRFFDSNKYVHGLTINLFWYTLLWKDNDIFLGIDRIYGMYMARDLITENTNFVYVRFLYTKLIIYLIVFIYVKY